MHPHEGALPSFAKKRQQQGRIRRKPTDRRRTHEAGQDAAQTKRDTASGRPSLNVLRRNRFFNDTFELRPIAVGIILRMIAANLVLEEGITAPIGLGCDIGISRDYCQ
jgi:hypothetical protein